MTAYDMRISDWSSDVCSSDLLGVGDVGAEVGRPVVVDLHFAVQEERLVAVAGFVRRGGVEVVHAAAVGGRNVEVVVRETARNRVEGIDAVAEDGVDEVAGGVHRQIVDADRVGAGDNAPRPAVGEGYRAASWRHRRQKEGR